MIQVEYTYMYVLPTRQKCFKDSMYVILLNSMSMASGKDIDKVDTDTVETDMVEYLSNLSKFDKKSK